MWVIIKTLNHHSHRSVIHIIRELGLISLTRPPNPDPHPRPQPPTTPTAIPPPHPPPPHLDKMADTFVEDVFKHIFLNEIVRISIKISLKFVPMWSNQFKSALIQVMAWRRTGDKPLPELMLTQFTDAYAVLGGGGGGGGGGGCHNVLQ